MSSQLRCQVLDPCHIPLHGVELAKRLLFSLPMFEDAGSLFDESAPFLRICHQDGIKLTLPDDDMHLSADAAVAEEFLDIEQACCLTIDLIFTLAIAEEDARDGHLSEFEVERTI